MPGRDAVFALHRLFQSLHLSTTGNIERLAVPRQRLAAILHFKYGRSSYFMCLIHIEFQSYYDDQMA